MTLTKTTLIHEMPCGYGTLKPTAVRIWHQVSCRAAQGSHAALEVLAAPKFDYPISQILKHLECTSITAGAFRST